MAELHKANQGSLFLVWVLCQVEATSFGLCLFFFGFPLFELANFETTACAEARTAAWS